jgi:hypothetical protein
MIIQYRSYYEEKVVVSVDRSDTRGTTKGSVHLESFWSILGRFERDPSAALQRDTVACCKPCVSKNDSRKSTYLP